MLREARRAPRSDAYVCVSGADPLNLVGIAVPGPKVPALLNHRVLYRDGSPIAALIHGKVDWIETLAPPEARMAEGLLVRRQAGSPHLAYLR
jgi:ATP-dependent Lhr-like helicase